MLEGNFYEIGASGFYLRYLLSEDWRSRLNFEKRSLLRNSCEKYFKDVTHWNGYFIDPNPDVIREALLTRVEGHHFNMAIGGIPRIERVKSFVPRPDFEHIGLCSLANNALFSDQEVHKTFYTSCVTLETLFAFTEKAPDLLSVDIEGAEREVFENYSFRFRPKVLIVDHHGDYDYLVKILKDNSYHVLNKKLDGEEFVAIDEKYRNL